MTNQGELHKQIKGLNSLSFSIIVPIYNTEINFVQQCLTSIINQSNPNWECIVVNNGSSIDYSKLITDERIKYINIENNIGIFLAYKKGFEHSTGDFIIHCDSDDWLDRNYLQTVLNNYEKSVDTYFINTISIYKKGYQERAIWSNKGLNNYHDREWFEALCSRKQTSWALWGKVLSRNILEKTYQAINCNEKIIWSYDCLLCLVYSLFSHHTKAISFDGFYYRINTDGLSFSQTSKEKLLGILDSESKVLKYLYKVLNENHINKSCLDLIKQELSCNFTTLFYQYPEHPDLYNDIRIDFHNTYSMELKPLKNSFIQWVLPNNSIQKRFIRFIIIKLYNIIKNRRN